MQISLFLISLLFVAQPAAFQIEGVPFVAQAREQCGPAALSSVLAYHGLDLAPETVAERTHNEKLRGSLITDLENFARGLDFQTKSGRGRKIPLYPPLRRELEATKHASPFVVGASKAVPDGSAISHAWHRVLRSLNSSRSAAEQIPEIRLHDLRGSFCTELLQI